MNLYKYVNNSPNNFIDPTGNFYQWIVITFSIWLIVHNPDTANAPTGPCDELQSSNGTQGMLIDVTWAILIRLGLGVGKLLLDEAMKNKQINDEINKTIDRMRNNKPKYPKDGSDFKNDGRGGGQKLPDGKYKEWTVDTPGARGRGTRRIVTEENTGRTYYTDDHYKTFKEMR